VPGGMINFYAVDLLSLVSLSTIKVRKLSPVGSAFRLAHLPSTSALGFKGPPKPSAAPRIKAEISDR